jgi:predicted dehydrogenase
MSDLLLPGGLSRRDLLKQSSLAAAGAALATLAPSVYAGQDSTVQIALVGCGGRGTGAVENALNTKGGPVKVIAMADVFVDRLGQSHGKLTEKFKTDKFDVSDERKFIGFDSHKKAMDTLRPGDVVILATPPAFRHVHFRQAIDRGLNVFMEKPVSVDGPSSKKMLALGEEAIKKGLKVAVGLMCRHCRARGELFNRIQDGQIGDLTLLRAYRVSGPTGTAFCAPKPADISELHYQIRNFHGFLWASGGAFSDFLIHNIDEACWMKNAFPVSAKGYGGRHYRGNFIDQNFDTYTTEYTYADGAKLILEGRGMEGCDSEFATYVHGTKGSAVVSESGHAPSNARIFKSQKMDPSQITWKAPSPEANPYDLEWQDLLEAIRADKPYSEVERGAKSSLVTAMGRMACHTGKVITFDEMLNFEHEFAPNLDKLTLDSPSPLMANAEGKYPVPQPGLKKREY